MSRPGWHDREYLPHYDGPDVVQNVVFRLADSLPASVMDRIARLTSDEKNAHIDRHLDIGSGEALLANPSAAHIVVEAIKHFDGVRYALHAWCVMPNHVHVVLSPLGDHKLGSILHTWKSFTGKEQTSSMIGKGRFGVRTTSTASCAATSKCRRPSPTSRTILLRRGCVSTRKIGAFRLRAKERAGRPRSARSPPTPRRCLRSGLRHPRCPRKSARGRRRCRWLHADACRRTRAS